MGPCRGGQPRTCEERVQAQPANASRNSNGTCGSADGAHGDAWGLGGLLAALVSHGVRCGGVGGHTRCSVWCGSAVEKGLSNLLDSVWRAGPFATAQEAPVRQGAKSAACSDFVCRWGLQARSNGGLPFNSPHVFCFHPGKGCMNPRASARCGVPRHLQHGHACKSTGWVGRRLRPVRGRRPLSQRRSRENRAFSR